MRQAFTRTAAIVALTVAVACASLSVKQQALAAHQTAHSAIVAIDDFERTVCKPNPPPADNTCSAVPRVLTDDQHQRVSAAIVRAYEADIRVGRAIILWQPGQPAPAALPALQAAVQEVETIVHELAPGSARVDELFARAQALVERVRTLILRFAGGGARP